MDMVGMLLLAPVAGWLAGLVMQGHGYGLLGDTVLGAVGALLGAFLFSTLFGVSGAGLDITGVLVATSGAVLALGLGEIASRLRHPHTVWVTAPRVRPRH